MTSNKVPFFVFDVESVGLHGEGYAVAGGVYFSDGSVDKESEFVLACDPALARGDDEDRTWVKENIPWLNVNCGYPVALRTQFWDLWKEAKRKYPDITMAAECAWPVEAGFLSACVADDVRRKWEGPYPLHEIASVMLAAGMDPMATYERLESELPAHHPLGDARLSSRLLCEALEKLK